MEPKLDLINSVRESENGEVGTLNRRDNLVALLSALTLIVGGDWDEMSELLSSQEVLQKDALIHFMVESDLIERFLEVPS